MNTADLDAFARRVLAFHAVRAPATPRWALDVARRSESPPFVGALTARSVEPSRPKGHREPAHGLQALHHRAGHP
ncbi:hypothetical protein G6F31_021176 [Rhizopus arrhizus]|nr:hypothetical protein G6F31_021176 [Rhizopus arrhizus]